MTATCCPSASRRLPRPRALIGARRAGRHRHRDGLRPRRRRDQRRRGRAHLRSQGPAELQSADRPRRRPGRGAKHRRVQRRGAGAGRAALAGTADPGRAAAPGCGRSPRWSPPACRPSACAFPRIRAMQALLRAAGTPLAAPSANASGSISPTRAEHVLESLGGRIALIVDDGPMRARHRIDHRRGDRRAAPAAAPGADRSSRPAPSHAAANRGAGPAGQPLCAVETAQTRRHRAQMTTSF